MGTDTLFRLFEQGGITLYVLVVCSVIVVAVTLERSRVFWRTEAWLRGLLQELAEKVQQGQAGAARQLARSNPSAGGAGPWPLPEAGASSATADRLQTANLMRISLMLGRNLPILATVGSIAPFIGLFGTVIGIMRAFQAISVHRAAGIAVVGAGIAEALICTAAGLAVAIVSVVAFNAFKTRSKRLLEEAEVGYLDLLVLLQAGAPKEPEN